MYMGIIGNYTNLVIYRRLLRMSFDLLRWKLASMLYQSVNRNFFLFNFHPLLQTCKLIFQILICIVHVLCRIRWVNPKIYMNMWKYEAGRVTDSVAAVFCSLNAARKYGEVATTELENRIAEIIITRHNIGWLTDRCWSRCRLRGGRSLLYGRRGMYYCNITLLLLLLSVCGGHRWVCVDLLCRDTSLRGGSKRVAAGPDSRLLTLRPEVTVHILVAVQN